MYKHIVILALATAALSAEIPSYSKLEKHGSFNSDIKASALEERNAADDHRPVYRAETEGRARIEPVRPQGPVIKHDGMLADQPDQQTGENRVDNLAIPNYAYAAPTEVTYPDIAYAPAYGYDTRYPANSYDMYNSGLSPYSIEPDTSAFNLLWSQVPDSRTLVSYAGRTIAWIFNSMFVLILGSFLTVGICSYTNLCTIDFHGVGPIHEEMRSLMTPERLDKISTAADFVKSAINKYQNIQKVSKGEAGARKRRGVFY